MNSKPGLYPMTNLSATVNAQRYDNGVFGEPKSEPLTMELPLQITINGQPFSVTMRTPGADEYLVTGLLFTEGVAVVDALTCQQHATNDAEGVDTVNVDIPEVYLCESLLERRSLMVNAACGLCGQREFDAKSMVNDPLVPTGRLRLSSVAACMAAMSTAQPLFSITGSSHAAAAFTLDGERLCGFEDVGRHNAVDKVIGQLVSTDRLNVAQVLAVSGRISFEIVLKAYRAGLPFLLAVSAPSSMAVERGQCWGMTLLGYCRDRRATVYSNADQVEL